MSLAADTRAAVRARPFVLDALRAGLLNHSAAAAWLAEAAALDGEPDAVAAALRRFREDLPAYATESRGTTVSMRSGVGLSAADGAAEGDAGEPLLRVGDAAVAPEGDRTAIVATGDVDAAALGASLRRLAVRDIEVPAAGVAENTLVCVVGRRDGPDAVRIVEAALDAVPTTDST
ncbi:hypothetical protein PM076_00545 [Halorubrum ezzemoulense]|uniref:Uncharacterized protein n=1 Tax=Halorubrum ezzemoulense TaxID=337243 RepID=A0A256J088_HALEZ|nr:MULTISPECIES: hypothetical protein [Halorubrum]MDB2245081.1 hypothetical protein [Halorubrum ezzemoulense]MDB2252567.1 hypothetical protein [Halorubrum ezzemoulense]MDB2278161.1 hypothetical protein [Halorubrum ezzemoulense]MDB2284835.1 hypothetical protein [Halorubrum ezzemoulense]MDB2288417.1 hypothetical protein [Halorubrum ezzemoulense]